MGCGNSTDNTDGTAVRRGSSGRLSSENLNSRKYNASRTENNKNDDVVMQDGEMNNGNSQDRPPAIDIDSPSKRHGPATKEHPASPLGDGRHSHSEDGITDTKTTESSNPAGGVKSSNGRKNSQSSISTVGATAVKPDDDVDVWMTPPPSPTSRTPLSPEMVGSPLQRPDNRSLRSNGTGNSITPFSPTRLRGGESSGDVPSTPKSSVMEQSIASSAAFNSSVSRIGMTQESVASGCVSPLNQSHSIGEGEGQQQQQQAEFGSFPAGGFMTTPAEPDNNVGDCEQAELARQVYANRKESVSGGNTEEPSPFMQKCQEAYRGTKYRAVAALTHETDHDELYRISLKPKNQKMIQRCTVWVKSVSMPQPRKIKFKKLNELRTLTEGSPDSVHFGRSISMLYYEREGLIRSVSPHAGDGSSVRGAAPFSPLKLRGGGDTSVEGSFRGGNSSQYLGSYTSMPGEVQTTTVTGGGGGGTSIHQAPTRPVPVMMSLPPSLPPAPPSAETKERLEREWQ